MLRRTFPNLTLVFVLFFFTFAACGGPNPAAPGAAGSAGAADAATSGNAATDASQSTFAEQEADGIHGWLSGAPVTGATIVDAYLVGDDGEPVEGASVTFDIDMTNMSHGKQVAPTTAAGEGHYAGDVHFMMPGPWRIIATIERPGQSPVQLRFEFQVQRQ